MAKDDPAALTPAAAVARHLEWLEFALAAARDEETRRRERLAKASDKNRERRTIRLAEVAAEVHELAALVQGLKALKPRPASRTAGARRTSARRAASSTAKPTSSRRTRAKAAPAAATKAASTAASSVAETKPKAATSARSKAASSAKPKAATPAAKTPKRRTARPATRRRTPKPPAPPA